LEETPQRENSIHLAATPPRSSCPGELDGHGGNRVGTPEIPSGLTYRDLFEAAPDAMLVLDQSGRIVVANRQAEQLFGYESSELLGQPIEALVPERFESRHRQHREGYAASPAARPMGTGLDLYARRRDGTEVQVLTESNLNGKLALISEQGLHVEIRFPSDPGR
jgi:PAS domain S-box-containing protein